MAVRYGVPYKGSKNQIAGWIVSQLPKRKNFYDLFAGGCAVTHRAMLTNKFENFVINDITDVPSLFLGAVNGKYAEEKRWISREDFYSLKGKDPYIRYCWSFGNNGKDYLYSKEIEPWKKALHYARLFNDFSLLEEFGIKTDRADRMTVKKNADEWKKKYILWYCKKVLHSSLDVLELQKNLNENIKRNSEELRNYLVAGLKKANKRPCDVDRYLGTNGMAGHYFGKSQWEFPTREVYIKLQDFLVLPLDYEKIYGLQELLQSLKSLKSLGSLKSLKSLQSLQSLESLERLFATQKSYNEVEILPDSLIYCDIPYKNTSGYIGEFNHEEFYNWCREQKELLIISEYTMPDDFICIAQKGKRVLYGDKKVKFATEKLFIPKHQEELYNSLTIKERVKNAENGLLFTIDYLDELSKKSIA